MSEVKGMSKGSKRKTKDSLQENPHKAASGSSPKSLQVRSEWQDKFEVLKGKTLQRMIFYRGGLSFRRKGEEISQI